MVFSFGCLMQPFSYMLWMSKCSMTFLLESKVNSICNKWLVYLIFTSCICSGGIYYITMNSLI